MNKLTFTTDIHLDEEKLNRELSEQFQSAARHRIRMFFDENKTFTRNLATGIYDRHIEKGDGLRQIEDFITEKFCSDEFKQRAEKFANENWERIFEECLTKALQHKANAIAFATAKELNPRNTKG
jgi:hypothetical protein